MKISAVIAILCHVSLLYAQPEKVAYNEKAIDFVYKLQYDSAVVYFSKVIALSPEDEIAYLDRGLAYEKQHMIKEALADFEQQRKIDPEMPDASFLKGILLEKLGDTVSALKEYLNVTQLDFYNSDAHYYAARCYQHLGYKVEADSSYSRALQANPSHYYIVPYYVLFRLENNQLDGLEKLFKAVPEDYDDPQWDMAMAIYHYKTANFEQCYFNAQQAFQKGFYNQWMTNRTVFFTSKKMKKWLLKHYSTKSENYDQLVILQLVTLSNFSGFSDYLNQLASKSELSSEGKRVLATHQLQQQNVSSSLKTMETIVSPSEWDLLFQIELLTRKNQPEEMCSMYHHYLEVATHPNFHIYYNTCGVKH